MIRSEFIPKSGKFIAVFKDHQLYKEKVEMVINSNNECLMSDNETYVSIDTLDEADHFLIPEPKLKPVVVYDMPTEGEFTAYHKSSNQYVNYQWLVKGESLVRPPCGAVFSSGSIKESAAFYIIGTEEA
jgi:hypothetical protein